MPQFLHLAEGHDEVGTHSSPQSTELLQFPKPLPHPGRIKFEAPRCPQSLRALARPLPTFLFKLLAPCFKLHPLWEAPPPDTQNRRVPRDPGAGSGPPLASLSVAHACHLAAEAGAPDAHALGARSRGLMTRL